MEHIIQFDWHSSKPDVYFLDEDVMQYSVTEKILRNKFHDPIMTCDSEEEHVNINWDEVFTKTQNSKLLNRIFVPCLGAFPPYPKLSAMDGRTHYWMIKVLCAENPHILPEENILRPTKSDRRTYEEFLPIYEQEKKEYIAWAKTLWTNSHCIRALHPKPHVETVYEARFKIQAKEMEAYPKTYDIAAQIPLETNNNFFDMVLEKALKRVNIKLLPHIECRPITQRLNIIQPTVVPEPCTKHPCRFILPNENSVSILPLTEVQKELAQYGLDNNAQFVASENALKCLVELDRSWDISVAVAPAIEPDGETKNIVVLGNEFAVHKESVLTRTYKAFKHLLQHALVPPSEEGKLNYRDPNDSLDREQSKPSVKDMIKEEMDVSSDEEDHSLYIAEDLQKMYNAEDESEDPNEKQIEDKNDAGNKEDQKCQSKEQKIDQMEDSGSDFYSCTCKDTMFERPPPRSFKKWQVRNRSTGEKYSVIIHCAHKVRDKNGEVLLEPIPEYQLDVGARALSPARLRSLALSLHLRRNASLLAARVDGGSGEVASLESVSEDGWRRRHGDVIGDVSNALHTTLDQLQGLRAGNYVLRHEPSHGANALLYTSKPLPHATLTLDFDCTRLRDSDEAKCLKTPPTLEPALLPFHKYRKVLPCAFTPHQHQLPREPRRAAQRQKTPPRALQLVADKDSSGPRSKWPKRNNKKNKKN